VALSETQPVLLAIDDLQWLDAASASILGYVVRRLTGEPIGLLATRRVGEPAPLSLDDVIRSEALRRETIGPLSMGAIHHIIRAQLGTSLARPTLLRVHQASGGNPLFALEIGRVLAEAGPLFPGQPIPIPSDVESIVRERLQRLPGRTRETLLAAGALAEPRVAVVSEALGRPIDEDLELARSRQVAAVEQGVIRFRHPLFGSALYASAPASQRRQLHGRLATVVSDAEERARHLALAVAGRDEETAKAVHATAREASRRGAPLAAIELLEHALAIGQPDPAIHAERIYDLADNLALAGDNPRAREMLDSIDPWRGWPPHIHGSALELMLELVYWMYGPGPQVDGLGERLLGGELPPAVRAEVHNSMARFTEHDLPRSLEHSEAALRQLDALGDEADPVVVATALTIHVRDRLVLGHGFDRAMIDRALELETRAPRATRRVAVGTDGYGQWVKYADGVDEARDVLEAGLARDLEAGYEKGALNKLQHLALTECLAGNLELAREHALRACELHDLERNRVLGYAYPILAIIDAHRGDAERVYAVRDMYREQGNPVHLMAALGLLELSLGNDRAALDQLQQGLDLQRAAGLREPGIHRMHANAAEAAVTLGDLERAQRITDELEEHGRRVEHRWSLAAGARCRALIRVASGDVPGGLAACDEAMAWHESLPMPFERARTLLVKGVIERRARRRSEAHRSLTEAAETFERMGARLWAGRARAELKRIGLRRSTGHELTEGERRCAELAASGMTNREVAAALFISPKTVEANLARVYRKLGIGSRAELGSRMREYLPAGETLQM
jgi:DNA-binding CsgD family transcriptional regulator